MADAIEWARECLADTLEKHDRRMSAGKIRTGAFSDQVVMSASFALESMLAFAQQTPGGWKEALDDAFGRGWVAYKCGNEYYKSKAEMHAEISTILDAAPKP